MSVTPIGALGRGLVAGAAASYVMDQFLALGGKVLPDLGKPEFDPPEPQMKDETATQTVARRFWEGMMQREPLSPERKAQLATAVHYWFGSEWGAAYGLVRESLPGTKGPLAGLALGTTVWGLGDYGLLPLFRLGAGFRTTPPKMIAFTWAAHAVYGLAAWAAYEATRPRSLAAVAATLFALKLDQKAKHKLPARFLTPKTRKLVRRTARKAAFYGAMGATIPRAVGKTLH